MISKFINWNSKVNKYVDIFDLVHNQPGFNDTSGSVEVSKTYWDYYLNYLTEARINSVINSTGNPDSTTYYPAFLSFKSYRRQFSDTPTGGAAITNLGNILNPSIAKVIKCDKYQNDGTYYNSGFSMNLQSYYANRNYTRHFDSIVIQLNKLDKNYIKSLENLIKTDTDLTFVFESTRKIANGSTTNSTTFRIIFDPRVKEISTGTSTLTGDSSHTTALKFIKVPCPNINEGLFVIDKEIFKHFVDLDSGDINDGWDNGFKINANPDLVSSGDTYITRLSFYASCLSSSLPELEIANLTFTNATSIYLDNSIKVSRKNLTNFNMNKKTGVLFPDINEYSKSLDSKISLMTLEELKEFDVNVVKNNMNSPFYFFPFCEPSSELTNTESKTDTNALNLSRENYELGGFFTFDPSFDITNTDYDTYDIPVKLDEYK